MRVRQLPDGSYSVSDPRSHMSKTWKWFSHPYKKCFGHDYNNKNPQPGWSVLAYNPAKNTAVIHDHHLFLSEGEPYRTTLGKIVFAIELNEK